jgi:tetratricopeptide (TPR) repeat protein
MALEPGDEVRTGSEAKAEIHFDNGQWVQIGPNSSTQVHGSKAQAAQGVSMGEKSFEVVQNFLKLKDSEGTSSLARLRSGDKHSELRTESPMQTKVMDPSPTFKWTASDPSQELKLTLYSDEGVLWEHEVSNGESTVSYPGDAPGLTPETTYSWVLETTDPLVFPPLRSEAAFFEVLSPDERKSVEASLGEIIADDKPSKITYHLVRASLFYNYNLMEDAIAETKAAIELEPDNSDLHAILARLYSETGRTQDAVKEYDRLLEGR